MSSAVADVRARGALDWAHPVVREWFLAKFGSPTEPQIEGWPHILAGRTTLIAAPTGSGKTLAAFLACIDQLVRKSLAGELRDCTEVLYVSPLKALGNDIQKNLEAPLAEIMQLASERGYLMPEIRTAVRTGDTLSIERQRMLRRPPHILVTTPESLYILLTAEKSRRNLAHVRTVIVDEIHAVAGDKRGAHLLLSLERLEGVATQTPVRIGLSATQKPLEEIAHFLTGSDRPAPAVVDVGHRRQMDLAIEVPNSELGPIATNEQWDETYDRLAQLAQQHRSTLVFVNTRRLAERVALHLGERLGENQVAAHHGSLARKLRLEAETKLKNGEIKLLVATASLQLGIDIGFVDLVCQLQSSRGIAVALQRIGRAGHWRGAIPKGRLFPATRDDLVECAALIRAINHGDLDRVIIPEAPLDILAQQIVAEVAARSLPHLENAPTQPSAEVSLFAHLETGIGEDELFALVKNAYPYRELTRELFDEVLDMLADGIASKRGRYGAYIHRDRVNKRLRARRGARLTAVTSGGAIPETALYGVVAMPEGVNVGTVDEDWAVESLAGDIFLLGNTSWKIQRIESNTGRVLVEDAAGQPPNIPFWRGEAPARTNELSTHVGELREHVSKMMGDMSPVEFTSIVAGHVNDLPTSNTIQWLKDECGLDDSGAQQLISHILHGRAVLGEVPTKGTVIAERFFDEGGGMQLIIHAPFGARVNKAWGLALRKRFCKSFNFELQAAATDNGLNICLAEQHSFPLADVFNFLQPETVGEVLQQAVLTGSPIFQTRWRWDANRSLALLRYQGGKKVPPQIQRMRSDDLLASVFPDVAACFENIQGDIQVPDHPLVKEVMKDVMNEAMDLDGLRAVLAGIRDKSIRAIAVDTPVPSQFSHEILNANPYAYLDDAPLEERRARAVSLRQTLPQSVLEEVGALDLTAIEQVREEAWPDVRDADELADALFTMVALSEDVLRPTAEGDTTPLFERWAPFFAQLQACGRAGVAHMGDTQFWVSAEKAKTFQAAYPFAAFEQDLIATEKDDPAHSEAVHTVVQGWMQHLGPVTAQRLANALQLHQEEVLQAMLRLEASGTVLRGWYSLSRPFDGNSALDDSRMTTAIEWCERRLLARIHRLTLGRLRKEIEPVTPAQFMRWLLRWQHVEPGSQATGERGLHEVIQQLQGFEIPANAWERYIFAQRVRGYDHDVLDDLCLTGAVGWGRLSPHPATIEATTEGQRARRVVPTSVAPMTLFLREESNWMAMNPHLGVGAMRDASDDVFAGLGDEAKKVFDFLRERGASFFADVVRATGKQKHDVETALWELVAAGLVTADGFDNLRSLIDPARRNGKRSKQAGRWTLLYPIDLADRAKAIEATCWMLLRRYGVVFRELLARETMVPKWRELCIGFRRLEDRGEIRGGRFVSGFLGEQFALPVAVESVRGMRKLPPSGEVITLSAADPLNLVGIVVPGDKVPAISGRYVRFKDGVFVSGEEAATSIAVAGD
ncbi:MAG TPA: DEAD/DEAH box helicase [Terriglobales bacterium]|nr:DEAD/DEAH box helicase [Terriglobales bacterium]